MKLRASIMNFEQPRLWTPIVNIPSTPLARQSKRQNVEPERLSISKLMDSRRHMWKNVLYWMLASPAWCRKLQNMNVRGSYYMPGYLKNCCVVLPPWLLP